MAYPNAHLGVLFDSNPAFDTPMFRVLQVHTHDYLREHFSVVYRSFDGLRCLTVAAVDELGAYVAGQHLLDNHYSRALGRRWKLEMVDDDW